MAKSNNNDDMLLFFIKMCMAMVIFVSIFLIIAAFSNHLTAFEEIKNVVKPTIAIILEDNNKNIKSIAGLEHLQICIKNAFDTNNLTFIFSILNLGIISGGAYFISKFTEIEKNLKEKEKKLSEISNELENTEDLKKYIISQSEEIEKIISKIKNSQLDTYSTSLYPIVIQINDSLQSNITHNSGVNDIKNFLHKINNYLHQTTILLEPFIINNLSTTSIIILKNVYRSSFLLLIEKFSKLIEKLENINQELTNSTETEISEDEKNHIKQMINSIIQHIKFLIKEIENIKEKLKEN